jgi:hypothetical protein
MVLAFAHDFSHYIFEPLWGWGYQFWSGIGSDLGELVLITGLGTFFWRVKKKTECHVEAPKNCHRFGYPVPGTGHRACRKHHPHAAEKGSGITAADIAAHHEESGA